MKLPNPNLLNRGCSGALRRRIPGLCSMGLSAFTLIELILVLALLVIITSLILPRMSGFIHGRALDSEARRMLALMHATQNRAVSEGAPMMFWLDEKNGEYGEEAEVSGQTGDAKAETLDVEPSLKMTVSNTGSTTPVTFHNLPAIRFLPGGTVDENSPQMIVLTDSAGVSRWITLNSALTDYAIDDSEK